MHGIGVIEAERQVPAVRWEWVFALVGGSAAVVAAILAPTRAGGSTSDTWPPFVLVLGLLLVGTVAEQDGVFRALGHRLALAGRRGSTLFCGSALLVTVTTATLNLDTSVVFITPILVATAARRGDPKGTLLCLSLLLANAGSLFLPGSNLTNLIVLGPDVRGGGGFLAVMWPAAVAAAVSTAGCVWVAGRRGFGRLGPVEGGADRLRFGLGLLGVLVVTGLVLALRSPAPDRKSTRLNSSHT